MTTKATVRPGVIAIVGSRKYRRLDLVDAYVDALPDGVTVVSGGAPGVDTRVVERARARGLKVKEIKADWTRGKQAGMLRNQEVVDAVGEVVAFWDGSSPGTHDTIKRAHLAGKLAAVYFDVDPSNPLEPTTLDRPQIRKEEGGA